MSILRPYQRQAITAAWEHITPETNRVAIEMATGLGKTITFAALIDEWLQRERDEAFLKDSGADRSRALVLVHTDELVRQAVDKISLVTGGHWTIGVVKAGQNEVHADIIVASVQTLAQPGRREQITDVGLIVVDECHHATATTYQAILRHYGSMPLTSYLGNRAEVRGDALVRLPSVPTFGFTATLSRSDGTGLGQVWQDLAFSRSLPWAVRQGWLVDLVPYTITIPMLDGLESDRLLDAILVDSLAPEAVVQAWMEKCGSLDHVGDFWPSTVLFAPLVRSAQAFADAFQADGVKAEVVHGAMSVAERQAVLARYEAGVTTVICNAMVLTEGWDSPRTSCVIVARPTQSVPLFVQMVGRGLRPWLDAGAPPRADQRCVLLAVQGATTDLATVADLSDKVAEAKDGQSLLAMEDQWDLGRDLPDEVGQYRGPVRVEQWDAMVQASSKAWKHTEGGVPFLPTRKRGQGYVYVVETDADWQIWSRMVLGPGPRPSAHNVRLATAPDLELALALAEDEAQERGGDLGSLLADKTRPWRKAVPSAEMVAEARRVGVAESAIARVLSSKSAGKAGRLSDLIDKVTATKLLDPNATKIRERARV
jgi:superfamily II DNA or RNA helicase